MKMDISALRKTEGKQSKFTLLLQRFGNDQEVADL